MKVGIMQPYFFPYLGYWQLMNLVDRYVVYDDVNFIKGGWINRNAILMNGAPHNINLLLSGASPNKLINEVEVNTNPIMQTKLLRTIEMTYKKAPFFAQVYPLLEEIITQTEPDLGKYLYRSFQVIAEYLEMKTQFILSSEMEKNCELKGYEKVIDICKRLGATDYYNAINGVPLYEPHRAEFEQAGIELHFLKTGEVVYPQYKNEFVPNLSIIDVLMFNSKEECQRLLMQFDLV